MGVRKASDACRVDGEEGQWGGSDGMDWIRSSESEEREEERCNVERRSHVQTNVGGVEFWR